MGGNVWFAGFHPPTSPSLAHQPRCPAVGSQLRFGTLFQDTGFDICLPEITAAPPRPGAPCFSSGLPLSPEHPTLPKGLCLRCFALPSHEHIVSSAQCGSEVISTSLQRGGARPPHWSLVVALDVSVGQHQLGLRKTACEETVL